MMPKIKQLTALRNSAILGLSSIVLSSVSLPAQAIQLSNVTGDWTSVNGGQYVSGEGTNQVRWGNPATPNGKSGLGFVGSAPAVSLPLNTNFVLGTLTHYNFPVYGGTAASGANLWVSLTLANAGETINRQFDYGFNIDETLNQGNVGLCDPSKQISGVPCDDVITFDNSQAQNFFLNGNEYKLAISGFSSDPNGYSPLAKFTTVEGQQSNAYILGNITAITPPPTPVPWETDSLPIVGSVIAFGFGLRAKQKLAQKKLVNFE